MKELSSAQKNGLEKLLNTILTEIYYPVLTEVELSERPEIFNSWEAPDYTITLHTTIPEAVTNRTFWYTKYWDEVGLVLDYEYINDVHIPEILDYFNISDREFNREVEVINKNGDVIVSTTS